MNQKNENLSNCMQVSDERVRSAVCRNEAVAAWRGRSTPERSFSSYSSKLFVDFSPDVLKASWPNRQDDRETADAAAELDYISTHFCQSLLTGRSLMTDETRFIQNTSRQAVILGYF